MRAQRPTNLWSLRIKWRHFAPLRLCALARMSLLIQAAGLAKAQRRNGRKGKILAMVGLNSQRPLTHGMVGECPRVARATAEFNRRSRDVETISRPPRVKTHG